MNSKQSTMQSARKKLVAATAMLLVACIMTISSTYAWFTLSTAPEVKGITTNVGANGNLEIALGTYETVDGIVEPSSYVGSSMDTTTVTNSNITWGNLIDLSDPSYGLGNIVLYPSRLNVGLTADGKGYVNRFSPLAYAVYGSDGRVMELSANTLLAKYQESVGFMALETPDYAGVNGIGSVSDMSEREFAGRNYKNAVESNRVTARNEALGAINLYSGDLAGLAIKHLSSADDVTVTEAEVAVLKNLIAKLESSSNAIDASLKSAILVVITASTALKDEAWEIAINGTDSMTASQLLTHFGTLSGLTASDLPDSVTGLITDSDAIAADLAAAKGVLPESGDSTWGVVKNAVGAILSTTGIEICGEKVMDVKNNTDGARDRVMEEVLSGDGLKFSFAAGSGIFADIADFVGSYTGTISFPEGVQVEGVKLGGVKKPVEVKTDKGATGDLGALYVIANAFTIPGADAGAQKALTDTYGYSVDLLFRTNATDSYLELLTEGANRVYGDNNNEALMGAGSNMSFTISGEYTKDKINGLAEGLRVVFFDTTSADHEIFAIAKLDTANGVVSGDQYKLNLKLASYTVNPAVNNVPSALAVGDFITDDAGTTVKEDVALTALTANQIKKVTALVYLDGDVIDNGDAGVAANLNGKLNLQFGSSATLTPMDNEALKNYEKA